MPERLRRSLPLWYAFRWPALVGAVVAHLIGVAFLAIDIFKSSELTHKAVRGMIKILGFEPWALQGVTGIVPKSTTSYALWVLFAALLYGTTQVLFLGLGKRWWERAIRENRLSGYQLASVSLVAAMLSIAAIAAVCDIPKYWLDLRESSWIWFGKYGLQINAQTLCFLAMLGPAWAIWWVILANFRRNSPMYIRLLMINYCLFVAAGVEAIVVGLYMAKVVGFDPPFYFTGSYSAMVIALAGVMWTAGPGITLLFTSQRYFWRRFGKCEGCGYDLRVTMETKGETCPECGRAAPDPADVSPDGKSGLPTIDRS
jgi:hypothetical protein